MYDIEDENRFWSKILTGDDDECWECVAMLLDKHGYGKYWAKKKHITAHRFSYQLFHNRLIQEGMCILHSCDNRKCVNPSHLSEGTIHENNTDREIKGRGNQPKGEKHSFAKLTEKQVKEIRAKYAKGHISITSLAKEYDVSLPNISIIINRKIWKHI